MLGGDATKLIARQATLQHCWVRPLCPYELARSSLLALDWAVGDRCCFDCHCTPRSNLAKIHETHNEPHIRPGELESSKPSKDHDVRLIENLGSLYLLTTSIPYQAPRRSNSLSHSRLRHKIDFHSICYPEAIIGIHYIIVSSYNIAAIRQWCCGNMVYP